MQAPTTPHRQLIESFHGLIRTAPDVRTFWEGYVRIFAALCDASESLLVGRTDERWRVAHACLPPGKTWPLSPAMCNLADNAAQGGVRLARIETETVIAVRLDVGPQEAAPVLLVNLGGRQHSVPPESTLLLAATIPSFFQVTRQYQKARGDVVFFAELLQLVGAIVDDEQFRLAVMRLCNQTASLFRCEQVSLGWKSGQGVRLCAISNLETFDERANAVWELEAAMEECIDQDAELLWPAADEKRHRMRAHETYVRLRPVGHVLSLPIRSGDRVVGALTCERKDAAFDEDEVWRLRLLLEQCARWLDLRHEQSGWIGLRLWRGIRRLFARIGSSDGIVKLAVSAVVMACLGFLFLGTWPYTVEGPFLLKAENAVHITAPVDGYIETARVQPGDLVASGTTLATLDMRDLLIEQTRVTAKLARHRHEAEKARADNALAEMRIAQAMEKETLAELETLAFHLEHTRIHAPFDAVVVEGDLHERIGAPVRQGETLIKMASLSQLRVDIEVDERDIGDIRSGASATIAFVGNPGRHHPVTLERVIPLARVAEGRNCFTVRAEIRNAPEPWWRPGMSGVAKIEVGRRSPWWILTHTTIDYLRLRFWI